MRKSGPKARLDAGEATWGFRQRLMSQRGTANRSNQRKSRFRKTKNGEVGNGRPILTRGRALRGKNVVRSDRRNLPSDHSGGCRPRW